MIAKLVSNQFHVEVPKLLPEFELWQQWRQRVSNIGGTTSPFPSPLLPSPSPTPLPSTPLPTLSPPLPPHLSP